MPVRSDLSQKSFVIEVPDIAPSASVRLQCGGERIACRMIAVGDRLHASMVPMRQQWRQKVTHRVRSEVAPTRSRREGASMRRLVSMTSVLPGAIRARAQLPGHGRIGVLPEGRSPERMRRPTTERAADCCALAATPVRWPRRPAPLRPPRRHRRATAGRGPGSRARQALPGSSRSAASYAATESASRCVWARIFPRTR